MNKSIKNKPVKKSDHELWTLIENKIFNNHYIILPHAKKRQKDRGITDLDVLDILENKQNRKRTRNKRKDTYSKPYLDWQYCIEGLDLDGMRKIRIIVSFSANSDLLIITVIRHDKTE